jgi:hypothetical protein
LRSYKRLIFYRAQDQPRRFSTNAWNAASDPNSQNSFSKSASDGG